MQFATINDVTLHYQIIGAVGEKPVLVFANSLGTDFRIWRDVVVQLVGDFSIVTYDKRGHGLSDIGPIPQSMNDHVGDLIGLLEHLEVSNAVICGVSVGGMIAQGLALSRPDLVRALILCDTAHKIGNEQMWNERIAMVQAGGIEAIAAPILERWFSAKFRAPTNPDFAAYRNMLIRTPAAGYTATSGAIRDTDFTDRVGDIDVPTFCLVGKEDGATPPDLVLQLARLIPGASYEVIDGAGHLPCIEQPDIMVDMIRAFLATLATGGADHE